MTFEEICTEIRTLVSTYVVKAGLTPSEETINSYLTFTQIYPMAIKACVKAAIMAWVESIDAPYFHRGDLVIEFRHYGLPIKPSVISQALRLAERYHELIYLRGAWRKSTPELRSFKFKQQRLLHIINTMTPETAENSLATLIDAARNMQGK